MPHWRRALPWLAGALALCAALAAVGGWRWYWTTQPVVLNGVAVPPVPTLDARRVAEGERLYAGYCAGCHGVNRQGAPDWRLPLTDGSLPPPPHDDSGHTWHHADSLLARIVLEGGAAVYGDLAANARMPAFEDKLSADEAAAVIEFLKSRWGREQREFQWWVTATGSGR